MQPSTAARLTPTAPDSHSAEPDLSAPRRPLPRARIRRAISAIGAIGSLLLTSAGLAAASHPGGEGTVSPLLRAHLSADTTTSLVVEIDAQLSWDREVKVVFYELAAAQASSSGPLDWRERLVGSRVIAKRLAVPGQTLELPLPTEVFGTAAALGIAVLLDSGAKDPLHGVSLTSVAVPPLDPAVGLEVSPAAGSIVVTEFMKDPMAVSDFRGEWLELQNRSDVALDLEGWTLRDDGSNRTVIVAEVAGAGVLVPAGGFAVLARNGDTALNGGVVADAIYSGFTLANGADQIILEAPGGLVIDRVYYLDGGDEGWPDASGASISLSPRFTGTADAKAGSAWCSGTLPMPLGDLGSPGAENADC